MFPESVESFRTVWKVSGQSGKLPDSLESFRTVEIVFGQSGKFLDSLEIFWVLVWKVPDSLVIFWTVLRQSVTIYTILYMS